MATKKSTNGKSDMTVTGETLGPEITESFLDEETSIPHPGDPVDTSKVAYFSKKLRVKLTDEERIAKGTALASILNERDSVADELGLVRSEFRERIKILEQRAGAVRRDVEEGTEERNVRCVEVRDYRRGIVLVKRTDTHEVIDERAMEETDRQLEIDVQAGDEVAPAEPPNGKRGRRKKADQAELPSST